MFTTLEKRILWTRVKTILFHILMLSVCSITLRFHWIVSCFLLTIFLPSYLYYAWYDNLYFPYDDYFFKCYFKLTKEQRIFLSEQTELLGKYLHLGEAVFLDEFIVLKKLGVVLNYHDVERVFYKKIHVGRDSSVKDYYHMIFIRTRKKHIGLKFGIEQTYLKVLIACI